MILQMPLSNMNGLVIVLKSFGNGNLIECNKTIRLGGRQFIAGTLGAGCSANVTNIDSARVFTRENACPGRRTYRAGRVGIGKLGSIFCHFIDKWSFVKSTSIEADIRPTKIIN